MHTPKLKKLARSASAAILSLTLSLGGLPLRALAEQQGGQTAGQAAVAAAAGSADDDCEETSGSDMPVVVTPFEMTSAAWRECVEEMLAKGDYVEGEVIVTSSTDLGMPSGDTITGTVIMEMSGRDYEQATGTLLPEQALVGANGRVNGADGGVVTSEDVNITIQLIQSSESSTEELLLLAPENETILDISPNYIVESPGDDASAGSGEEEAVPLDLDGEGAVDAGSDGDDGVYGVAAEGEGSGEDAGSGEDEGIALLSLNAAAQKSYVPSAPADITASADLTSYQWAYNKNAQGFKGLLAEASGIDLDGWNTGAKNSEGVVAVFDSGVDYTHPDLSGAFFDMTPYLSQTGGTSHGFDALVRGTNAATNTNEPIDQTGHGTHVAGIIAAQANGFGVSGYASGAKLLSVRVANSFSKVTKASFLAGVDYVERAVKAGVDIRVINNSWDLYPYSNDTQIVSAIYRMGSTYGITFVFASGNQGTNIDALTPAIENLTPREYVITVDSSDLTGGCSAFSSFGCERTDLFAPGSAIMSTLYTSASSDKSRPVFMATAKNSYGFESFDGSSTRGAYTVKGKQLASTVDGAAGFDSAGGCLSLPTGSVKAAAVSDASSAKTRVVIDVPVDEADLKNMSEVGCAVSLSGYPSCLAWLEVMATWNGQTFWTGDINSKRSVDDGNWAAVSLDMSRVCTSSNNYQVKLFHDEGGQAYIKVAVCLNRGYYDGFGTYTVGLRIDSVGVGNTCWNYGFMSGTSMAAPLVSGLASSYAYRMGSAYSSLSGGARAQKLVSVVKKSVRYASVFSELCSTDGVVDPTLFDKAIASDKNAAYISSATTKAIDDDTCEVSIKGSGFGDATGTAALTTLSADADLDKDVEILSWSDSEIRLKAARIHGRNVVTTTVTSVDGETVASKPMSVHDSAGEKTPGEDGGDKGGSTSGGGGTSGGGNAGATQNNQASGGTAGNNTGSSAGSTTGGGQAGVGAAAAKTAGSAGTTKAGNGGMPKTGDEGAGPAAVAVLAGGAATALLAAKARRREEAPGK